MASKNDNIRKRAEIVQKLVSQHYEPGNQSKSKIQAYRNVVNKIYPMSERTFWRLLNINSEKTE